VPSGRQAGCLPGLTFLAGGLVAYAAAQRIDIAWMVPFAAGNVLYIGASDLVPEVNREERLTGGALHVLRFVAGPALLAVIA
jgi:zinc and cadmium transporter